MKSADFLYHRPRSVEETVSLLRDYGGAARILAGGQSIMPMMNLRLWRPAALIDITKVPGLGFIECDGERTRLGALVRYVDIEFHPVVAQRLPLLAHMIRSVGDRQVRNRGTIGGSLVQADPTGEMPLAALALRATVVVVRADGRRSIPTEELFLGSYSTALDPTEMLIEVHYPRQPQHFVFHEITRRHNDFALLSLVVVGDRDREGIWRDLRIGLGGVDETPVLARRAMALCEGTDLGSDTIDAAALAVMEDISPVSDVRASAGYRQHLAAVYLGRSLRQLAGAAQGRRKEKK